MMLIYTCPNCGGDLHDIMLACNPPIHQKVCHNCGWSYEDPREEVIRVPFNNINDIDLFNIGRDNASEEIDPFIW